MDQHTVDRRRSINGDLPWYAIFRIPLSQLIILGTILISLTGVYFRGQIHAEEIQSLKATSVTKDEANDIKARLDRIENKLDRALEAKK